MARAELRDRRERVAEGVWRRFFKSGKSSYELTFTYQGVPCKEPFKIQCTKSNDRIAVNRRGAIKDAIDRGTFVYSEFFPESKRARLFGAGHYTLTFEKYATDYWSTIEQSFEKPSTRRQYQKALFNAVMPHLGPLRLQDIRANDIRKMIKDWNVVAKTARNRLTIVREVFSQAAIDKEITTNPCDGVKVARLVDASRKSVYEVDPYSPDEIVALIAACDEFRHEWTPYWLVAFFTGMRPSEQYGAVWSNYSNGTLAIRDTVVERVDQDGVKTDASERDLPFLPIAAMAMDWQSELTRADHERIFWNPRKREPLRDYEESQRCLKYICRKTDIRYRNQYQTRHSFASNLLSQGENMMRVAHWMGHKTVEMLIRNYGRYIEQGKDAIVNGTAVTYGQMTPEFERYMRSSNVAFMPR